MVLVQGEHRSEISVKHLNITKIGRGKIESEGLDISFIALPPIKVAELKSYKQFFNFPSHRSRMLNNSIDPHDGIWSICGTPDERTTHEDPQVGFGQVKSLRSLCVMVIPGDQHTVAGFDYIDAMIEDGENIQLPNSFGGVSGGGLWQVTLKRSNDGKIEPAEYLLWGTAFYEHKDKTRYIRCHGKISLYEKCWNEIESRKM